MFIVFIIIVCIAAWLMFADNSKPEKILRTLFCKNNEFEEMFFFGASDKDADDFYN